MIITLYRVRLSRKASAARVDVHPVVVEDVLRRGRVEFTHLRSGR
jgi:hypothetical protein